MGRRTSATASGSLPTPVKYDSHGTWESNNYHGLGWQAKHNPQFPTPIKSDARISKTDYVLESVERGQAFNQLAREIEKRERVRVGTWPTPKALDHNKRGLFDADEPRNGLPGAVRRELHKTPLKGDATQTSVPKGRVFVTANGHFEQVRDEEHKYRMVGLAAQTKLKERMRFPTPVKFDSQLVGNAPGRTGGPSLKQRIRALPTPNAWDSKAWVGQNQENLAVVVMEEYEGDLDFGELSPWWTEWLMGWVIGWTGLEPVAREDFDRWLLMVTSGRPGDIAWWHEDPSESQSLNGMIPRTCAKDLPARVERIAAIGNGQVSAVAAAAYIYLDNLEYPKEQP